MADYFQDFPFEEIRREDGNYFNLVSDAIAAGHTLDHIWSVTESEGTVTYGPSRHYINRLGYIATAEAHDDDTYYHEEPEEDEDD